MRVTLTALVFLICSLSAPAAQEANAVYDVRILGLKLGEMVMSGRIADGTYTATSTFRTTGMTGRVAKARFAVESSGAVHKGRFVPARYSEDIDTGRRQSSARLTYRRRTPRVTGGTLAEKPDRPDPSGETGSIDPMTLLFAALRDQPGAGLCTMNEIIFDGARRSSLRMTERSENGEAVICTGLYRRLKGFSERELKRQTNFPFRVTYRPHGDVMRAVRLDLSSTYGKVVMHRR